MPVDFLAIEQDALRLHEAASSAHHARLRGADTAYHVITMRELLASITKKIGAAEGLA
jgi:hypothetical protein